MMMAAETSRQYLIIQKHQAKVLILLCEE